MKSSSTLERPLYPRRKTHSGPQTLGYGVPSERRQATLHAVLSILGITRWTMIAEKPSTPKAAYRKLWSFRSRRRHQHGREAHFVDRRASTTPGGPFSDERQLERSAGIAHLVASHTATHGVQELLMQIETVQSHGMPVVHGKLVSGSGERVRRS